MLVFLLVFGKPIAVLYDLFRLTSAGKYLVLFQNNAELRGGGGFLGSFAVIDLDGRKVKKYYFEANIYKKDNEFTKTTKNPQPKFFQEGLGMVVPMALRDANHFADFSDSAQEVANYYTLEYGEKVDGIIAINATMIQSLLKMTGPIALPSQGVTVSSDNFFDIVQQKVDNEYFKDETNRQINEPKNILKELVNPLLIKARGVSPFKWYAFFKDQVASKQLLFWFKNNDQQRIVEGNGWAGRIINYPGESIFISNNNIAGNKSSLSVDQSIKLVGSDKRNPNRILTITRSHKGGSAYQADATNKNYMNVFLPPGSAISSITRNGQALSGSDVVIEETKSRVSIGLWATTELNKETVVVINYELAQSVKKGKILYQRQPGSKPDYLEIIFNDKAYINRFVTRDSFI